MKSSSTTILWNGKDIPDDYLKKVLSQHSRSLGLAIPGKGVLELLKWPNTSIELAQMKAVLQNMAPRIQKDDEVLIVLQDAVKHDTDLGPYPIVFNAENQPVIVACLDGDFSAHAQADHQHLPEMYAVDKIKSKAQKLYKMLDGDLVKVMDELNEDEFFSQALVNMIAGERGSITLMSGDGATFTFKVNDDNTSAATDYGWVSNTFSAPAPVVEEKPKSLEDDLSSALGISKSETSASTRPKMVSGEPIPREPEKTGAFEVGDNGKIQPRAVPGSSPVAAPGNGGGLAPSSAPLPADGKVTGSSLPEFLELPIPQAITSDPKRLKSYLVKRIPGGGPLPKDWASMKSIVCARTGATRKFLEDYGRHMSQQQGMKAIGNVQPRTDTAPAQIPEPKPTSVPQTPAPVVQPQVQSALGVRRPRMTAAPGTGPQPEVKETPAEKGFPERVGDSTEQKPGSEDTTSRKDVSTHNMPPILSPAQKTKIAEMEADASFKTGVDRHSQLISNPKNYPEVEKMFVNLAHQIGKKSVNEINWGYPEMVKVAKEIGVEAIATLAFNRHFELKKLEIAYLDLLEENEKLKAQGTSAPGVQHRGGNSGRPRMAG